MKPLIEKTDWGDTAASAAVSQEVDVWWGGYAGRTMLPSLCVCLGLTVVIIGLASYLGVENILRPTVARWLVYGSLTTLWLIQLLRWTYRLAGWNYRLTTQRLHVDWGFHGRPPPPVELAHVREVRVEQTRWERWLNIGRIVVTANPTPDPLVLPGVRFPQVIAAEIEMYVRHAQSARSGDSPSLSLPFGGKC